MRIKKNNFVNILKTDFVTATLNSYSIIFFLENRVLSLAMLFISFFNFWAGLSGLLAVIISLLLGNYMHIDRNTLKTGIFSFNALLTGIGLGTYYDPGISFFVLLIFASLISFFISVNLWGYLSKFNLPFLSIPFILSFWLILFSASGFQNLGLTHKSVYWLNELYSVGGDKIFEVLKSLDNINLNRIIDSYLRSLSSILFQNNRLSGLLLACIILFCSRIMFSLSVISFITAYIFSQLTGAETISINYYNLGANYMMVAFAIGGYYIIPSKHSYLWSVILVFVTCIYVLFLNKLLLYFQLPVFSLPFAIVAIQFLYFLRLRNYENGLSITIYQQNSPEKNLYNFLNNKSRLKGYNYIPLDLPVIGSWTISQAYNGDKTHLGEWGEALDFTILDSNNLPYRSEGINLSDYYAYNKPVFAPSDAIVEGIIDKYEDNNIGDVDTNNNWGNSIVLKHADGLYSQFSHLKKGSIKVSKGQVISKGTLIASCGNSGRSPEPHLHFQIQLLPFIGSKTISYPFGYYMKLINSEEIICENDIPSKNDVVSSVTVNPVLNEGFRILPDKQYEFEYSVNNEIQENCLWDTHTNSFNEMYFHCKKTDSYAYYNFDGYSFFFTAFYGNKKSLLYYLYLSCYKVNTIQISKNIITDYMPLTAFNSTKPFIWLHDFIAPFYNIIKIKYEIETVNSTVTFNEGIVLLKSKIQLKIYQKLKELSHSEIKVNKNGLISFKININGNIIEAQCTSNY